MLRGELFWALWGVLWCCAVFGCGVLSCFFFAALWWSGAPKEEEKARKIGTERRSREPKFTQKSMKNRSWRALGRLWGALGGQDGPLRVKMAAIGLRPAT